MVDRTWVLFDVGGVLSTADDARWPQEFIARWAGRQGLTTAEFEARVQAADLPDASARSGVEDEFWSGYGAAVGVHGDELETLRADFWESYCGSANAELLEFVRDLPGTIGRAILSNSGDGARREEERRFGFSQLFDPILYSHEIGVLKPDRRAFDLALTAMGARADEVVFVDNVEANAAAAEAVGITAIHHTDTAATLRSLRDELRPAWGRRSRPRPRFRSCP